MQILRVWCTVIWYTLLSVYHENCLLYASFMFFLLGSNSFFKGRGDIVHVKITYVLRSYGSNKYMLLQHKKLKVQKTWGTEDKLYQIGRNIPESQSERYRLAVKSSENCISIAEEALRVFPMLEKVLIHERLPRADSLADLSEYSNFARVSLLKSLGWKTESQ